MQRPLVALGIILVFLGLMLGAQSQTEKFFVDSRDDTAGITGNLIPFTAALVGGGAIMAVWNLVRANRQQHWRPALAMGSGIWLLLVLGQSAYQSYIVVVETRFASLHISSLANDAESLPAAVLPIVIAWISGLLLIFYGLRGFYPEPWKQGADGVRRALLARALLMVPIFAAIIGSNIYLLATLDFKDAELTPLLVLAPMVIASSLTILIVQQIRIWNFGLALEDRRLGAMMMQSWHNLNVVELVALAVFMLACAGGLVLPQTEFDNLNQGRSFVTTIRTFVVLQILALIPMFHVLRSQRSAEKILIRQEYESHETIHRGLIFATIVSGWALVALVAGPWIIKTGIWVLIWGATPLAVYALLRPGAQGALPGLLVGALWWSAGNAFSAVHDPNSFILLRFVIEPGIQAVVRMVGTAFFVVSMYRIMQFLRPQSGLNAVASFGIGLAIWIEVSLAIWIVPHDSRPIVGIGSFIQSQAAGFQGFFHVVALLAILGAGVAWSAVNRPEWFQKREEPQED